MLLDDCGFATGASGGIKSDERGEGVMNSGSKKRFSDCTPDELRELYSRDPKLFAELADDAIRQACTGRTPEQTLKLQQMQWNINAQLRKSKTPLGRLQIMENIFYSHVYGDDGQLAQLISGCTELIRALRGTGKSIGKRSSKIYSLRK